MWLCSNSPKISFVAGSESSVTNYLDTNGVVANTWNDMKVVAIGNLIRLCINDAVKGKLHNTNRPQLVLLNDSTYILSYLCERASKMANVGVYGVRNSSC